MVSKMEVAAVHHQQFGCSETAPIFGLCVCRLVLLTCSASVNLSMQWMGDRLAPIRRKFSFPHSGSSMESQEIGSKGIFLHSGVIQIFLHCVEVWALGSSYLCASSKGV